MQVQHKTILPEAVTSERDPWTALMLQGAFEAAWKIADEAQQCRAGKPCWHLPRHLQYIWDGSSLRDKIVLVRCYHGLGDTIQFIRFMPQLRNMCRKVIVWADAKLIPLFNSLAGIDEIIPLHDGTPGVAYDMDIEIMELAHVFRLTTATIPADIPYITVPDTRSYLSGKPQVGVVWKSGNWDERRSIPYALFRGLDEVAGVEFVIVQPGAVAAGWQQDLGIHLGEFGLYDYARQLTALDLLITIDSMPAHLGGALGIRVWTLLQAEADWRWMEHREDSPWYPTMRLFRQEKQGEWAAVIEKVKTALVELFPNRSL